MTVRRLVATAACLALLGPACSPGGAETNPTPPPIGGTTAPSTSPTPSATPNPTATPVDVTRIPDDPADIDQAYVQAVLDELARLDAAALRGVAERGEAGEQFLADLNRVFTSRLASDTFEAFTTNLGPEAVVDDVEVQPFRLEEVRHRALDCLYLTADYDPSGNVNLEGSDIELTYPQPAYVQLVPAEGAETGTVVWRIGYRVWFDDATEAPSNQCPEGG